MSVGNMYITVDWKNGGDLEFYIECDIFGVRTLITSCLSIVMLWKLVVLLGMDI